MEVGTYNLTTSDGRLVRKATKVTLADGREIKFMERLSKREALRQAYPAARALGGDR